MACKIGNVMKKVNSLQVFLFFFANYNTIYLKQLIVPSLTFLHKHIVEYFWKKDLLRAKQKNGKLFHVYNAISGEIVLEGFFIAHTTQPQKRI